jgi:PAS domain S-box-containing protein
MDKDESTPAGIPDQPHSAYIGTEPKLPGIIPDQLSLAVFGLTALAMLAFEGVKEMIFKGTLIPWESHLITVVFTAFLALVVSKIARTRTLCLISSVRSAELATLHFLETLMDAIPVAVFYKDREGRYLGCNALFMETMGKSKQEICGKTVHELWPGELAQTYHQKDMELMAKAQNQRYEYHIKDKLGRLRDVVYSKNVFYNEHGEVDGIIGTFFDITEKKEAERELVTYRDQLEAMVIEKTVELQQKNADLESAVLAANTANRTKSAFLGKMSHELRTPMNIILGFAQLLESRPDDQEAGQYISSILESGDQMVRLIDNLLEISTLDTTAQAARITEFTLTEFLESALQPWHKRAAVEPLTLFLEIDPKLPRGAVRADADRLGQILRHLLDNACKFTERGDITLRAQQLNREGRILEARFEVEDQGIGISQDRHTSIFEPFEQVDDSTTRAYGGAGLGLAICKQLVETMGGEIGFETSLDKGSLFWFSVTLETVDA